MTCSVCVFDTPIGVGGLAWGDAGIVGVQLPQADGARARASLRRRFPAAPEATPPPTVEATIRRMVALLGGQTRDDLADVELDMERVPRFASEVYAVARTIRVGETATYGDIARRLGGPLLAREVGQALARNPYPIVVPCHRVLAAGGKLGGFSAAGGVETKKRLLAIEHANVAWQLPLVAL